MTLKILVFILTPIGIIETLHFFFIESPRFKKRIMEASDLDERKRLEGRIRLMSINLFWADVAVICLILLLIYRWSSE
jgi:hypothetical protein